mmetsp:Transcript_16972/g.41875  ORF Transcript_16972/g.41875 Transcript_16972/m.41875 type:complete len:349 (-) Transcript_16972:136-1182(-)
MVAAAAAAAAAATAAEALGVSCLPKIFPDLASSASRAASLSVLVILVSSSASIAMRTRRMRLSPPSCMAEIIFLRRRPRAHVLLNSESSSSPLDTASCSSPFSSIPLSLLNCFLDPMMTSNSSSSISPLPSKSTWRISARSCVSSTLDPIRLNPSSSSSASSAPLPSSSNRLNTSAISSRSSSESSGKMLNPRRTSQSSTEDPHTALFLLVLLDLTTLTSSAGGLVLIEPHQPGPRSLAFSCRSLVCLAGWRRWGGGALADATAVLLQISLLSDLPVGDAAADGSANPDSTMCVTMLVSASPPSPPLPRSGERRCASGRSSSASPSARGAISGKFGSLLRISVAPRGA